MAIFIVIIQTALVVCWQATVAGRNPNGNTVSKYNLLSQWNSKKSVHSKKGLVDPTNGLLINTLYDVFKQHIPLVGIVRITM